MTPEAFEDLVLRVLDGRASEDDRALVNRMVRERTDLAELYVRIAGMESLLRETYEQTPAPRFQAASRPLRRWIFAAAASILVGVAAAALLPRSPGTPVAARVVSAAPGASLLRDGNSTPVQAGMELRERDELHSEGADLEVACVRSANLQVGPYSILRISGQGARIEIDEGSVSADVTPRQDPPLVFATPVAEATVVGTRLSLLVSPVSTLLAVGEGEVEIVHREEQRSMRIGADDVALMEKATPGPAPVKDRIERSAVEGVVLTACPQGRLLEVRHDADGKVTSHAVAKQATGQVKALRKGDRVAVTLVRCPRSGQLVVVAAVKR